MTSNGKEWSKREITFVRAQYTKGFSQQEITKALNKKFDSDRSRDSIKHCIENHCKDIDKYIPKVLLIDLETSPNVAFVWGQYKQDIPVNMLVKNSVMLSWSAKWLGDPPSKTMYMDQRGNEKNLQNDKKIVEKLHKLINEADILIYQNGDAFDRGVMNTRFLEHGLDAPSAYKTIDTVKLARRHFRFFSNKLEYMTHKLCVKFKKQSHKDFPGFSLWDECMKGNKKAWRSMERYNKYDVLSLEEVFLKLVKFEKGNTTATEAMRAYHKKVK
jgi:DNA polymerase elongation subunit (family B)